MQVEQRLGAGPAPPPARGTRLAIMPVSMDGTDFPGELWPRDFASTQRTGIIAEIRMPG